MQFEYPRYVYKFRFFDQEDNHVKILSHNEVFFSSPIHFNDPFDCRIPIRYDLGTKREVVQLYEKRASIKFPNMKSKDRRDLAKKGYKERLHLNRDETKRIVEEIVSSKIGVLPFSANFKSLLNWAHYSDSHAGFCIGFDLKLLTMFCLNYSATNGQAMSIYQVKYQDSFPIINPYRLSNEERFKEQMLIKSSEWAYEEEFRIILQDGADRVIQIPNGIIKRVILGSEIKDHHRKRIIDIANDCTIRPALFEAKRSKDNFALVFNRLKD